jgi:hypothetical protein
MADEDAIMAMSMNQLKQYISENGDDDISDLEDLEDFQTRAMLLFRYADLKSQGLEQLLVMASPDSNLDDQEVAIKSILEMTLVDDQERSLFLFPGVVDVLVVGCSYCSEVRVSV